MLKQRPVTIPAQWPAAVFGCDEPLFFLAKITTREYFRTAKTTKCFATLTEEEKENLLKSKDSKQTKCYPFVYFDSQFNPYNEIHNIQILTLNDDFTELFYSDKILSGFSAQLHTIKIKKATA